MFHLLANKIIHKLCVFWKSICCLSISVIKYHLESNCSKELVKYWSNCSFIVSFLLRIFCHFFIILLSRTLQSLVTLFSYITWGLFFSNSTCWTFFILYHLACWTALLVNTGCSKSQLRIFLFYVTRRNIFSFFMAENPLKTRIDQ